jgi:hypothetical protein
MFVKNFILFHDYEKILKLVTNIKMNKVFSLKRINSSLISV